MTKIKKYGSMLVLTAAMWGSSTAYAACHCSTSATCNADGCSITVTVSCSLQ